MSILVVAALKEELGSHFDDVPVCYTGVGKVNAAYSLTREIVRWKNATDRPDCGNARLMVVNFGTAASKEHAPGSLVNCRSFYQRDMYATELGYELFQTPFEDLPVDITVPNWCIDIEQAQCFTGDQFLTDKAMANYCGVHDMEAYALAKVCFFEKIPFVCVKYVSDSGSADEWRSNCGKAGKMFREVYERLDKGYR